MNNYDDILNNAPAQEQNGNQQLSKEEYAAMKKAERDDLFELSSDTANNVTADGGKFQQYMDMQSHFDRYSAVNTLLIMAQKPEATRLGDFDHWKNKNASMKPKQKGISILEPHEYTKDDGSPGVGYNVKKVFDISQYNTQKMKPEPVPPTFTDRQILSALVHKASMQIVSADKTPSGRGAETNPETGTITVQKGMEFTDTFGSLAKELAVAKVNDNEVTKIDKDFSAYCVSYMLCKKHGADVENFSFDDVGKVFEGLEAQEVKGELQMIRETFADINSRMSRQLEVMQKTARNNEAR